MNSEDASLLVCHHWRASYGANELQPISSDKLQESPAVASKDALQPIEFLLLY